MTQTSELTQVTKPEVLKIEAYGLASFAEEVQKGTLAGYRLDLESNENYPTSFGTMHVAGMKLAKEPKEEVELPSAILDAVAESLADLDPVLDENEVDLSSQPVVDVITVPKVDGRKKK